MAFHCTDIPLLFIHSSDGRHVSSFHLLAVVNCASINFLCVQIFI